MTLEEKLYDCLKPYCVELGWIRFDEVTTESKEITFDSEIIEWKVFDYDQETAVEYLKDCFPEVDESVIRKVVSNNIK